MIAAVAGIPSLHYTSVEKQAPTIFGTGNRFIFEPLRPDGAGVYRPDIAHVEALLNKLSRALQTDASLQGHGCGVFLLVPEGADIEASLERIAPFAIVRRLPLPLPVATHGRTAKMQANEIAAILRAASPGMVHAVNAMNSELGVRLNRTPLLLPLRNFSSGTAAAIIRNLSTQLPIEEHPHDAIANACRAIEARHPFGKSKAGDGRCFTDDRKTEYRLPGRANHGMAGSSEAPHNAACYLNGNLRLGGFYSRGFHYDCRNPRSSGKQKKARTLSGKFENCHDVEDTYTGNPHVNIAPNDFVRV